MMHHIAAFRHLHAEELALQVDAPSLLRPAVQSLQTCPRGPRFLAAIHNVVIVRVDMEQHQAERDVAHLDVVVLGPGVRKAWRRHSVDDMPHRLGQEHATHVAVPRRVIVPVELVDGDLGRDVLRRGHGTWAHNLLKSERRSEAWAERREGVQLKGLELKKVNLEVIDLSEL